jgi:hypothetical protein
MSLMGKRVELLFRQMRNMLPGMVVLPPRRRRKRSQDA